MTERRRDTFKAIFTGLSSKVGPGSTVYSGLKTSLTLLKETADASELPALKGAVGGLLKVVEIIERVAQNQDDVVELLGYLKGFEKLLKDAETPKISDSLAGRIEELSKEITKIVHDIRTMHSRGAWVRFIRNEADAVSLAGHLQRINRLFFKFLLGSSLALELQVMAVMEGMGTVEANIAKIGQGVMHLRQDGLPRVVEARFDGDDRNRCLEGTRVALLETIYLWIQQEISADGNSSASIFWLCGQAGTGKTTICSSVADHCHAQGRLGASFFFSRDHENRSDIRLVFPTLAHQLGSFCAEFKTLVTEILKNDPDLAYINPAHQLEKLIINPLERCISFPSGVVIIMDALDECKEDKPISTLLFILSNNLSRLSKVKFFITSRPENNIRLGFKPLHEITQSLILHDIDASVVDADIDLYLRKGFSAASDLYPHMVGHSWPSDEAIRSLVQRSWGLFIFAATALKFILDDSYSSPVNQLTILLGKSPGTESPPPSSPFFLLDHLYLQVLHQAFPKSTSPSRFTLLQMILGAIVLLRNPLSPGALESLLGLRRGVIRTNLRHLHSVMVVPDTDEHLIRLIHPSFFDFVTVRCSDSHFRINAPFFHEQLAILCFEQMKALKRDICTINDASRLNEEMENLPERVEQHIPPALRYACQNWVFHLCNAGESSLLRGLLNEFCGKKILYWIEALSLIDSLREGIHHLQTMQDFLAVNMSPKVPSRILNFLQRSSLPSNDLLAILNDTTQFTVEYFELISAASLQLYRSALPLSPVLSLLRRAFAHELHGETRVLQRTVGSNQSGLTILRGHASEIKSARFSPDAKFVVSACNSEVRLWDRDTGTLSKTLIPDSTRVIWAAFYPDGSRVISGTDKYIVYIWNVATGNSLQTINLERTDSNNQTISCYTCSSDATRIIGGRKGDILVWDISNGALLKSLSGHGGWVRSIVSSPDHKLFASASDDQTVRLWDAATGAALRTLQGHSENVLTVAFSPNSKYIASGSCDNEIRIWDATSGNTLRTLQGHANPVCSIAFSPDGAHILSGSWDRTLRFWDASSGNNLKTLKVGSGWSLEDVGFSPDGTQCISYAHDALYLWNADRTSDFDQSPEQLNVINVLFSPDGSHIIGLIHSKNDVYLWDGITGTLLKVLKGHSDAITSFAFSPDSKYIASGSDDQTVRLWDVTRKRALRVLTGHTNPISAVAFSPDSMYIVSTSYSEDILRIWDVNGNNVFTVKHIVEYGDYATFSPDGGQIVTKRSSYETPRSIRSHVVPLNNERILRYSREGGWILAFRGAEKQRCVWIPMAWRQRTYSSSHGRVVIGTLHGLVLLDLSGISLSI